MLIPRRALVRRAAGGIRAVGRNSLPSAEYADLKRRIFERAGYRCECCRVHVATELEHAISAGRGGPDDFDNCYGVCRICHRWKEAPFANGRMVPVPLGGGMSRWEESKGPDKWTATLIRIIRDSSL